MTAINGTCYAVGLKNEFQGTGVWGFIKAKREKKPEKEEVEAAATECKPCNELAEKAVRDPPKTRPDYHRKP